MKRNFAVQSLILFGVALLLWILLTLTENALVGISLQTERVLTFVLLVVPALLGMVLGALGLARHAGSLWQAILGVILNGLFASFHLMLLAFAG
jgi:hypothetical protein